MKICIVVARYKENLEWVKKFSQPNVEIIVYNKGPTLNNGLNEIALRNIGKEGHTYYKHICDNYDNLSDHVVFLQGNPFDHSPNLINNLNKYINNKDLNVDFEYLSQRICKCNLTGCLLHPEIPLIEVYNNLFDTNLPEETDMPFVFGAGAQFIVSKKQILEKPKEFYLKIVEMLEKDNKISPEEGYVIERFHKLIFETNYVANPNP